ncbi:MAG: hypothetical protein KGL39_05660 [Patescibacteria group bacterium]|nr:hypothetical protein [Patescibacteria group bacterium]
MPSKKPMLTFVIDTELLKRIDDYRFAHRFPSRAETIKSLLRQILDEKEHLDDRDGK